MNKIYLILILFLCPSIVLASERNRVIQQELDYNFSAKQNSLKVHSFNIAHQAFYNKYSKYKRNNLIGKAWQGVEGKYVFSPSQGNILNNAILNFYSIEGLYAWGKNTKIGVVGADFLTIKNTPGFIYETRALVGRNINANKNFCFRPYTGYGFRLKQDKNNYHMNVLSDNITPVIGYRVTSLYHYIPMGLAMEYTLENNYEISFNIEYDLFLKGKTKYRLTDTDSRATSFYSQFGYTGVFYEDLRLSQRGGFGLRSSIKFLKHFSLVDVYVEPFIRYWNIKPSKTASGYVISYDPTETIQQQTAREDKNYTLEGGLKTGLQF